MSIGFIFWLLMLLSLVFGLYMNRAAYGPWVTAGHPLLFILLFLIGWKVFGWPIAG